MSGKPGLVDIVESVERAEAAPSGVHLEALKSADTPAAGTTFRLRKKGKRYKIPRDRYYDINTRIVSRRENKTVYVEVDRDGEWVSRLLVPQLRNVAEIRVGPFMVEVRAKGSPLKFVLPRARFTKFEKLLRRSIQKKQQILITNDPDTYEILDVRSHKEPLRKMPSREAVLESKPLTLRRATEEFERLAQADDIPFDYPDEYCNARAHEMFRRLRDRGVACKKIWNFGGDGERLNSGIRVFTPNHPDGLVSWFFHVAVMVKVRLPNPKKLPVDMVFDPSLSERPVRLPDWLALQHDSTAIHETTPPEVFDLEPGGTNPPMYDDDFSETDYWLEQADIASQKRKVVLSKGQPEEEDECVKEGVAGALLIA